MPAKKARRESPAEGGPARKKAKKKEEKSEDSGSSDKGSEAIQAVPAPSEPQVKPEVSTRRSSRIRVSASPSLIDYSPDSDLAFDLLLQDLEDMPAEPSATLDEVVYNFPWTDPLCGCTLTNRADLLEHFHSKEHADAVHELNRSEHGLDASDIKAINGTVLFVKPAPLNPFDKIKVRTPAPSRLGRSRDPPHNPPATLNPKTGGELSIDDSISVLQQISADRSLAYNDSSSEDCVFILDAKTTVEYYGKYDQIPIGHGKAVVCRLCEEFGRAAKDLRTPEALSNHLQSAKHKDAAGKAAYALKRETKSPSSTPTRREPRTSGSSSATSASSGRHHVCSNLRCKTRIKLDIKRYPRSTGSVTCPGCQLEQEYHLKQ